MMKNYIIKCCSLLIFVCVLSACDSENSPSQNSEVAPLTNLSFMVNGIVGENLDHADHTTWNLDNFEVVDDIDSTDSSTASTDAQLAIDAIITAEEAKQ